MEKYRESIDQCCNPDCDSGLSLECHHIIPLNRGGVDSEENYIVLCKDCHDNMRLHSEPEKSIQKLLTYKYFIERIISHRTGGATEQVNVIKAKDCVVEPEIPQQPKQHQANKTKRNSDTKYVPTWVPMPMYDEMNKLIPGTYVNRTELVLKAIRKLLIEEHGVNFK